MPTLRIPFPEKDTSTLIELRGPRISIGRMADNAIQIRDRTVSAHHAELVEEGGHYRLHDFGSTNGLVVDGQPITDFHLHEACKIGFGAVECEFNPGPVPDGEALDQSRALVTRIECESVVRENAELKERIAVLIEQVERIQASHAADPGTPTVPHTQYDTILAEVTALKETLTGKDREIEKLQGHLTLLRRDHERLQNALEEATKRAGGEPTPMAPKSSAAISSGFAKASPAGIPASPAPAESGKSAPSPGPGAPASPDADKPLFVRMTPPAAKPAAPGPPVVPSFPKPPAKLHPAPAASASEAPVVRPFPPAQKPSVPVVPAGKPTLPLSPSGKPAIPVPLAGKPVPVKAGPASAVVPAAGPKGTQKIEA